MAQQDLEVSDGLHILREDIDLIHPLIRYFLPRVLRHTHKVVSNKYLSLCLRIQFTFVKKGKREKFFFPIDPFTLCSIIYLCTC